VARPESSDKLAALHICSEQLQQLKQDNPQAVQVTLEVHKLKKDEIHASLF
jgi:hypothetical protein